MNNQKEVKHKNPVIEYYRGFPIKTYNLIFIRVTIPEYKRFIDAKIDKGLSQKESIKQLNILCKPCNQINPIKLNKDENTY